MKSKVTILIFFITLFSTFVFSDECANTCDQDYTDCKKVAESNTQKQACEADVRECKQACKK
ncbi:MAG TPA: hypothetical protein PLF22_10215 [Pseudomonadales bacterium]|nr:hypothetical protein [Pseudomonadales bacterium]